MSRLGDRLWERVAYESFSQNFALSVAFGNFQTCKVVAFKTDRVQCMRIVLYIFSCFTHVKSQFRENMWYFPLRNFRLLGYVRLTLFRNKNKVFLKNHP